MTCIQLKRGMIASNTHLCKGSWDFTNKGTGIFLLSSLEALGVHLEVIG